MTIDALLLSRRRILTATAAAGVATLAGPFVSRSAGSPARAS